MHFTKGPELKLYMYFLQSERQKTTSIKHFEEKLNLKYHLVLRCATNTILKP